jgi:hypothetical protein
VRRPGAARVGNGFTLAERLRFGDGTAGIKPGGSIDMPDFETRRVEWTTPPDETMIRRGKVLPESRAVK